MYIFDLNLMFMFHSTFFVFLISCFSVQRLVVSFHFFRSWSYGFYSEFHGFQFTLHLSTSRFLSEFRFLTTCCAFLHFIFHVYFYTLCFSFCVSHSALRVFPWTFQVFRFAFNFSRLYSTVHFRVYLSVISGYHRKWIRMKSSYTR